VHLTSYKFVNLNNSTFQLKTLLFFAHLPSQQKRTESHLQLSNLQHFHFNIVILRVAIISNVQNVRLQRLHRPTDDASTRRWRGSQQTAWFSSHHTVRCAHKSRDVINFIIVACRISSRLKWYKNYKNRLRFIQSYSQKENVTFLWFSV